MQPAASTYTNTKAWVNCQVLFPSEGFGPADVLAELAHRKGLLSFDVAGMLRFLSSVVPESFGRFVRVGFKDGDGRFKQFRDIPSVSALVLFVLRWWLERGFEWSVFFTPWVRIERDGKSFGVVRALVIDLDFPELKAEGADGVLGEDGWRHRWEMLYERVKEQLGRTEIKPNYVVLTGNGAHLYFVLKEAWIEQGRDSGLLPLFEGLRRVFGGEPVVDRRARGEDWEQLFRLPFTYNPSAGMFRVDWLNPDNASDLGLRREFYTVEELRALVRGYEAFADVRDKAREAARGFSELPFSLRLSFERQQVKFLRMIKVDGKLRSIWFGYDSGVKRAKSASEASYILVRALAVRGFSPGFALEKLRGYAFGIACDSRRRAEMEKNPETLEKRLNSIVRGAYKDTNLRDVLVAVMEPGRYYSPSALAKRAGVRGRLNDVRRLLSVWRSLGLVEARLVRRRGMKRKVTLYRLTDSGLRHLKKRRIEGEPRKGGNDKGVERLLRLLRNYPNDMDSFREYVKCNGVPPLVARRFERYLAECGINRERGSPKWVDYLFFWVLMLRKRGTIP